MLSLNELLEELERIKGSDLHLTVGVPPVVRINGDLVKMAISKVEPKDTEKYVNEILSEDEYKKYNELGEIDISYSVYKLGRYRVNIYRQRGTNALAIRRIENVIPKLKDLKMPEIMKELTKNQRGLVLVTGPTGSGKSTTLAAMINEINDTRSENIITLEDPIEYLHRHKKSIISQREIGRDSKNYSNALRAILREDPDVILIGEMRDLQTISIAITAAETGHLVFSTVHTIGAAKTIDRIIDVFPSHQQQQIRMQLAAVLRGIVSQQLLPMENKKGRVAGIEIMVATSGIQNLIREGKTHQIQSSIQTGARYGMQTMDMSLTNLYKNGIISYDTAITYSIETEMIKRLISL